MKNDIIKIVLQHIITCCTEINDRIPGRIEPEDTETVVHKSPACGMTEQSVPNEPSQQTGPPEQIYGYGHVGGEQNESESLIDANNSGFDPQQTAPPVPPAQTQQTATPAPPAQNEPAGQQEQTAPPAPDAELDSEGLPWDERIHSSGKTKYKQKASNGSPAGSWKLKKGVDAVTVAQIKTELRNAQGGPPAPTEPPQQSAPTQQQTAPTQQQTAPTGELPEYGTITSWGELMRQVVGAGIDRNIADQWCAYYGANSLIELQNSPGLIPQVAQALGVTK